MGHRLSKTTVIGCNASKEEQQQVLNNHRTLVSRPPIAQASITTSRTSALVGPTINLQIQDTPTADNTTHATGTHTVATTANSCSRQYIIKIQLAKMEPGHEGQDYTTDNSRTATLATPSNNNGAQFLNFTFNRNVTNAPSNANAGEMLATSSQQRTNKASSSNIDERTAGSSSSLVVNNNFSPNIVVAPVGSRHSMQDNFNILMGTMTDLQMDEKRMSVASVVSSASSGGEPVVGNANEYYDEPATSFQERKSHCVEDIEVNNEYCCRRKSKSATSKWRCCKCTCRDAIKRIMDVSSSKSSKKKNRNENSPKTQQHSTDQHALLWTPMQANLPHTGTSASSSLASNTPALVNNNTAAAMVVPTNSNAAHMSIWSPNSNDFIIPISSPQFVVVQCPPSSLVTLGRIDDNAIRLMATELVANSNASSTTASRILATSAEVTCTSVTPVATPANSTSTATSSSVATPNMGVNGSAVLVVHSQVDYIHCLVPDLEKITKASFYWGKMDRYEAERLLEGKPEGTFLLRDSAQEEYLFSVTFRKYGRSLHARIEQSNHKFSFDCHDPCVFTAPTVTGLLEHYKDPACVMFFEPMLTIPLHRNTTFSLQQLCRATIVSHTTYDGINELELPSRLKSYLKEYHYKQKLRVKPFDEPFYSCT